MKETHSEWLQTVHGKEVFCFDYSLSNSDKDTGKKCSATVWYRMGKQNWRCRRTTLLVSSYYASTGNRSNYEQRMLVRPTSPKEKDKESRNRVWYINQKFDSRKLDYVR